MKKSIALLCTLVVALCAVPVLAQGRTAPEDKKVITTDDVVGTETVFKKYDKLNGVIQENIDESLMKLNMLTGKRRGNNDARG